ncbi:COG1361 S-layer family protein [Kitasatospora griseola]|uniref:COG1361 S-layer family protein n=1 Tax=Kitasatospora griseola TaxID=2064 RepID=UPI00381CF728
MAGVAELSIEKTADSAGPFRVGDTVSYTYTVTNTGTAAVHNLTVTDDHVTGVTCNTTTLNPGQSTLCHGSYVITAADVQAGHVTNTAHANGTDPDGQEVKSPPDEATVPVVGEAVLSIEKTADSAGPFHVGDTVSYTYTVTNTGTAAVHNLTVTDDHVASVTCDATTLNPGQSTTCHGTYVVTAADVQAGHVTNTAHAEGTDPEGQTVLSPPGEATVPVVGEGELSIEKTADSAGPFHVGDTVHYTYTVTNTGTAAVHNLTVTDDHVASVTCDTATLNPGQSTLCHGTYIVTAADVQAGHVTNTAHANGTDPEGQEVKSPPDEATVPVVGEAVLSIEKTADSAGPFHVGDTVNYTYTVTNTGTAAVHNVTVTDDHVTSVTCDTTTLNPGQSTLCHGSYVVSAADVQAGHVTNTAHATGTDPEGQTVQSPPGEATVPVVGEGELAIEKTADSAGPFHVGETVNYTYTVTNTGTGAVHNVTVTDDHVASVTCDATSLNPGQSTLCHGSYVITAADVQAGHVTNTAHANGTDPEGQEVKSPPIDATVPVVGEGQLTIEKAADSAGPFHVGETVHYTYTVTNTGTGAVDNIAVADDRVASVACGTTTLNPGASTLCHGSYVITAADVTAGHVTNTAHASGTDPEGQPVQSAPDEATVPVAGEAVLSIEKTADSAGPLHVGDTVSYTYTVTNTGTAAVHNVSVSDDRVASVTCDATTLNPGQSTLCHGSYVITAADVQAGHVTNTAHATGTDPEGEEVQSPPIDATVPVVGEGELSIEKTADSAGPFHVGDTVHYTYTVTNTGTAAVHNLSVADDHVTSVTCDATTLNPGASTLCHGSYTITAADAVAGHVTNTARANSTDPHGGAVQSPPAEATVTVVGEAQLAIVKKADSAGPFRVGDTVDYTYTVTNTGAVVIHDIVVSDDRVASVACDATALNPGQSTVCHGSYTITEEDVEAGHVTNTARAKGVDPEGSPVESVPGEVTVETTSGASSLSIVKQADVSGSAHVGDTVTYTYTVTNTGTTVLTDVAVNDDRIAQVACDTATLNPGESTTCHGTYVVTEEDAKAGHVTNTATASGRDPQGQLVESRPVSLCVTVSECPEKEKGEGCVKIPRPIEPPKHGGGGGGHLPDTGSPAGLAAAGLAGGGLLTLGGVLLYRARRRANADRFVG